jgi:hypothetical protein
MPYGVVNEYQWVPQALILTYINATQFSILGDYSILFRPGGRVRATVTGPPAIIYGTVTVRVYNPVTGITTVTCIWDGGALDAGLSAIDTGIITPYPYQSAMPVYPPINLNVNTVFGVVDRDRTYIARAGVSPLLLTLPPPANVPPGACFKIINYDLDQVQLIGTVSSRVNPFLSVHEEIVIISDGTAWYGAIKYARPIEYMVNISDGVDEAVLDLTPGAERVIVGERWLVICYAQALTTVPTFLYMTTHQGAGTATIEWSSGLPNSLKKIELDLLSFPGSNYTFAKKTDVLKVTGTGTLTLHNRLVDDSGDPAPHYQSSIYAYRLRHI